LEKISSTSEIKIGIGEELKHFKGDMTLSNLKLSENNPKKTTKEIHSSEPFGTIVSHTKKRDDNLGESKSPNPEKIEEIVDLPPSNDQVLTSESNPLPPHPTVEKDSDKPIRHETMAAQQVTIHHTMDVENAETQTTSLNPTSAEIDENQHLETSEQGTPPHVEIDYAGKQYLKDDFLRTNIYENAPLKHTFDETLSELEKQVVESLSFMKQAIQKCINPAESDAIWEQYKKWFNYYLSFVQELSYGVVLKRFTERFTTAIYESPNHYA
jgi:hypothetical protein